MRQPFVWFDLRTNDADASRVFHEQLFGWDVRDVPMGEDTLTMIGGEHPWASIVDDGGDRVGWFPYVHVNNLEAATAKAEELGATVLQPPTQGPEGTYTPIREPGGAVLALFQAKS